MGGGKLKAAVIDSGPLIHLTEIGCLRFLNIFETLFVPHAVWLETIGESRISENDLSAAKNLQLDTLVQSEIDRFTEENNLSELHAGEKECLYLCQKRGISTLLTDDLAVRDAAKSLQFVPVGSLGIVVKAFERGDLSLPDAERCIVALYDVSTLFVTRDIADLAIEQLRRHNRS